MENAKVIALGDGSHRPLVADLQATPLDIRFTDDFDIANGIIQTEQSRVGLLILDEPFLVHRYQDLKEFLHSSPQLEWIGLVSEAILRTSQFRRLLADYLYTYHVEPALPASVAASVGDALRIAKLRHELAPGIDGKLRRHEMIGQSQAMRRVYGAIEKIARTEAPVLITGETGTGKELAAMAVHRASRRAKGPFVAVNCGALPANLIHSELFGHERGAYTGAHQRKRGRIEAARGGTLFLDEVGDLALDLQVNLLRFLQEGTFERLGGTETRTADVRVVAATHVDLAAAVQEGRFREDLYYRLNVLSLELPPLRERDEDIERLAIFFFHKFAKEATRKVRGFSDAALQLMAKHDWPGNIRELINRVRRAMVMCETSLITPDDLLLERRKHRRHPMTLEQARAEAERRAVANSLRRNRYNVTAAAQQLGVSRVTFYRLMDKYDIPPKIASVRSSSA